MTQFWGVDADVAIDYKNRIRLQRTQYILVMHVAQVDFGRGIRPVAWILEFKAHILHECCNLIVAHGLAVYIGLLGYDLEFAALVTAKAKHGESCLGEIGIVKGNSVEGKNRLDKIIQADRLD